MTIDFEKIPTEIYVIGAMSALSLIVSIAAFLRAKVRDIQPPMDFRTAIATLLLCLAGIFYATSIVCFYLILLGHIKHNPPYDWFIPAGAFVIGVISTAISAFAKYGK